MKLIDMLVEDGLNGWQWPDGVECITQDNGSSIYKGVAFGYHKAPYLKKNIWLANNGTGHADAKIKKYDVVADDWDTAIITREQYEAALAAKNDGWIDWGGGECPVSDNAMVDVRYRDGQIHKAQRADSYEWGHGYAHFVTTSADIIAYRLHQPQEAAQTKEDDEADLNECIGQDATPVWNGEGLPPVGCECECQFRGEWQKCTILFSGKQIVVVMVGDDEYPFESKGSLFRPIRSEAERKRDDICDKIYGAMINAKRKDNRSDMAEEIYDSIAAGKIPGLRLED
ncbi:hypothetical protein FDI66_gp24 [Aeromonas phage pIS4-A]|uniref:Uncharacterized protein n=2 Tax=Roufvirus pIS4A TaxID=1982371 RepID=R9TNF9_9CAUD|nr:hypothetical protein VPRG_00030 [Vibrio phage pYD38-A]YP_009614620.1 hypothetical protein FDI66_gp24 [Aeromonas phage pIS4-A]AGN34071.1 hypothetical protein AEPG_00024 [Aeromonas phage pIS4-A]AGN34272.1 hypothetical protein VPRG_00030 [Vibrio phage pYD38-A]